MKSAPQLAVTTLLLSAAIPLASAHAGTLTTLYSFAGGTDGQVPWAGVILVGTKLYGTTTYGGTTANGTLRSGSGTVFTVDPGTGKETVLHNFGTGTDGAQPYGGLTYAGGLLWGTTYGGGAHGLGTIFNVDPATGAENVAYSFAGNPDGANPYATLLYKYDVLFGTTYNGGPVNTLNAGTVFYFSPKTGKLKTLYFFGQSQSDGQRPQAGLTMSHNMLYGTTTTGGAAGNGTVFQVDFSGKEITLHSFAGLTSIAADGAVPTDAPVVRNGTLYGTTSCGVDSGCDNRYDGTVFSYDLSSGTYAGLYNFQGKADGEYPQSSLLPYGGALIGTTSGGGSNGGTIFKLNPTTKALTVLYTFQNYSYPFAGLLYQNGAFYGTTAFGGTNQFGSVYKFTP